MPMRSCTLALIILCAQEIEADDAKYHAQNTFNLGDGFDVKRGQSPTPLDVSGVNLPDCITSAPGAACIDTSPSQSTPMSYSAVVYDSASRKSLFDSTTSAEGGGWGLHMSASVEFMQSSSMSTRSVDLVVGCGMNTHVMTIQHPSLLVLNDAALTLLKADPELFLEFYGPHVVTSITYGGSYMGSYHLHAKQEAHASDLDVYAQASYSGACFDVSASENLDKSVFSNSAHLDRTIKYTSYGGPKAADPNNTAFGLGQSFAQWKLGLSQDNAVPLTLEVVPWFSVVAVAEIVANFANESLKRLFLPEPVIPETVKQVTEELSKLLLLESSIDEATGWACPTSNGSMWTSTIDQMQTNIVRNISQLQVASEADVLRYQQQDLADDSSWKGFDIMNTFFQDQIEWYKASCGGEFYRTVMAFWDPSLAGGDCKSDKAGSDASQVLVAENHTAIAGSCNDGQCELNLICARQNGALQAQHYVGPPCNRVYTGPWVSDGCSTLPTGKADGQCCFFEA